MSVNAKLDSQKEREIQDKICNLLSEKNPENTVKAKREGNAKLAYRYTKMVYDTLDPDDFFTKFHPLCAQIRSERETKKKQAEKELQDKQRLNDPLNVEFFENFNPEKLKARRIEEAQVKKAELAEQQEVESQKKLEGNFNFWLNHNPENIKAQREGKMTLCIKNSEEYGVLFEKFKNIAPSVVIKSKDEQYIAA